MDYFSIITKQLLPHYCNNHALSIAFVFIRLLNKDPSGFLQLKLVYGEKAKSIKNGLIWLGVLSINDGETENGALRIIRSHLVPNHNKNIAPFQ